MEVFSLDKEGNGKKQEAKEYKVKKEDGTLGNAESLLQEIIFHSPNMFPVSEISGNNTSNWIPLAMEVELKGHQGRLDILGTDGIGNIYIFECKLHTNAEMKTIHSQIGNYAAGFYKQKENMGLENFWEWFCKQIEENSPKKQTLENILKNSVGEDLVDGIIKSMKENLEEDKITLVYAVDKITAPLRNSIDWWNEKVEPQHNYPSFALEVSRYGESKDTDDISSIVVQTYPFSLEDLVRKKQRSGGKSTRHHNDEKRWMKKFDENKLDEEQRKKITEFKENLEELLKKDDNSWMDFGTGDDIRMMPKFGRCNDRSAIGLYTHGKLVLQFDLIQGSDAGPEAGKEFEKRINEIDEIRISLETRAGGGYRREPHVKLETWLPHKDKILSILEEVFMK